MSGDGTVQFLEKFVALLDSGRYTATYKFATLTALIDVVVESIGRDGRPPRTVSARRVGERVLELLWHHARPYPRESDPDTPAVADAEPRFLRHSTQTTDLVTRITAFRTRHELTGTSLAVARRRLPEEVAKLEEDVVVTVIRMPLPKLQRFSRGARSMEDRFIFDFNWPDEVAVARVRRSEFDDTLRLQPGVGEMFIRLQALLRPVIQERWAAFVATQSRDVLEDSWLDEFLFGERAVRATLEPIRQPLLKAQKGRCFFCRTDAPVESAVVDHFIPWARHPDNGLENLVAAHARCNGDKSASLAGHDHLGTWLGRFDTNRAEAESLREVLGGISWPSTPRRTLGAARAAYLWLPDGALLWRSGKSYEPADRELIRKLMASAA